MYRLFTYHLVENELLEQTQCPRIAGALAKLRSMDSKKYSTRRDFIREINSIRDELGSANSNSECLLVRGPVVSTDSQVDFYFSTLGRVNVGALEKI